MAIIFDDPPYADLRFERTVLEEFVGAGILMVEDDLPSLPPDWPLIEWVRQHVDEEAFADAVERGRKMAPRDRGHYLHKALGGECDG